MCIPSIIHVPSPKQSIKICFLTLVKERATSSGLYLPTSVRLFLIRGVMLPLSVIEVMHVMSCVDNMEECEEACSDMIGRVKKHFFL